MFNRSKAWAVALLVAVFVAGAVAGWGLQAWADSRNGGRGRGPRGLDATVNYLARELELTPAQRDSVRAVFTRRKAAMDALWQAVHPRFDSLRTVMRAEIRAYLTPTQQARYREMIEEMERRHRGGDSTHQRK
ncbi:MAG: periplasmic heavy metal sensor [Gemmatimonadetes bacterium]|nr:periplasmic heavy metal sensor [Gemmatimonadota bacterium]